MTQAEFGRDSVTPSERTMLGDFPGADPETYPGSEPTTASLDELVATLQPTELAAHPDLLPVFRAAANIVTALYYDRSAALINDFPESHEGLLRLLFKRFEDERGDVHFPLVSRGQTHEVKIKHDRLSAYRLQRQPPGYPDCILFTAA